MISLNEFKGMEAESILDAFVDWDSETSEQVEKFKPFNILFASYGCEGYEGDAFLLLEKDGELYEVNASHCSCYGLENQFEPELTNVEALLFRLSKGSLGRNEYCGNTFSNELYHFLMERS